MSASDSEKNSMDKNTVSSNAPGPVKKDDQRIFPLDELSDADRALAEQFGYQPVFKREFGYLSTFSFAFSISGLFATIATTFTYPLEAGGSSAVVWCWLISGAGCMCIAASVSELVSAYPTSGGLYFTVSRLAPPRLVPSISWLTGWVNLLGQIAGVASSQYGAAEMLLAAVSMGRDFTWSPSTGETVGVMAGLSFLCGILNSVPTGWMEKMTRTYVIFHLLVVVTCSIALLAKTENKHNASYVFTNIDNSSGWTPTGFSWLFGFLSVSWTMTDYDATAHIAEEIQNPEVKAPWAIFLAMGTVYVIGWLFNIVLCFCMGDPSTILNSPIQQPVAQIFYNSLGKAGGIVYASCAIILLEFICITATQSLARTVFAFSRDRLLPFSNVWSKVNPISGTPLYAVWFSVFWCIAINLIALGNYAAIEGVFNIAAIALDWSYMIPVICKMLFGQFKAGPWHMGKLSYWVNLWAVLWTAFVSVIFFFPTEQPVTAENMNYAIAFMGFIFLCSYVYWFARGRKFYIGPLKETTIQGEGASGILEAIAVQNAEEQKDQISSA